MKRIKGVPVRLECPRCGSTHDFEIQVDLGSEVRRIARSCSCGGEMVGPADTVYSGSLVNGELVTVLTTASAEDLGQIADVVGRAKQQPGAGAEEVADALDAIGSDASRALGAWVRENGGWLGALAVLIALLQLVQSIIASSQGPGASVEEVEKIVDDAVRDSWNQEDRSGRNQPCPCGSGVKFKNCHGLPESVQRELQAKRQRQASPLPPGHDPEATQPPSH